MTRLRIGTRGSALALWQSRHVAAQLRASLDGIDVQLVEIVSTGDEVTDVPLSAVEGTGFFTAALERALLTRQVDVAVHSCKDLPVSETPGLTTAAILSRGPVEDVLVARDGHTLASLPPNARVGTCSLRRTAQLRALRPDLEFLPLRGNVPTRVSRVTRGDLDAIALARAGLVRLGLEAHITEIFSVADVVPAPAQGAIAVQCRGEDSHVVALLQRLDDPDTRRAVTAERALLHALEAGCSVPVGAVGAVLPEGVRLAGAVFDMSGRHAIRANAVAPDALEVAGLVGDALVQQGAMALLGATRGAGTTANSWPTAAREVR